MTPQGKQAADTLRLRREELDISQASLAELVGKSERTVRAWETHSHLPAMGVMEAWAEVLGMRVGFVLEVRDE